MQGKKLLTDILLTSRIGGRKGSRLGPVRMNIYQSNIYIEDLSQLHFDDEPRFIKAASEGPTVLHIYFCSLSNNCK